MVQTVDGDLGGVRVYCEFNRSAVNMTVEDRRGSKWPGRGSGADRERAGAAAESSGSGYNVAPDSMSWVSLIRRDRVGRETRWITTSPS